MNLPWIARSGVLCALLLNSCSKPEESAPDHVLLVVIDTLRADHLSSFGYARPTSPNIDRLARSGVRFTRAISQASWTGPSMVSLMTGRYIAKERVKLPTDLATLAESFQRAGWATGGFASNPLITQENGFARGFDVFAKLEEYGPNDEIERFLAANKDKRTFTYVHITEPHDPYLAPKGQQQWREAASFLPGDRVEFYAQMREKLGLADIAADVRTIQAEIGGYDDDVKYADGRVAAVLALFDKLALRDETVVALTSDHGEGLWQHVALMNGQRGSKLRAGERPNLVNTLMPTHGNQVHQSLVHVPLVLAGRGVPSGAAVNAPVENVDLFPTLLELANVRTPGGLQGRSLLQWLDGRPEGEAFGFSFTRFNVTVVDEQSWALILPTPEGECAEGLQLELFYLKEDPHQRVNRAADRPEIVARLTKVAEERMAKGIRDADVASESTLKTLAKLGYLEQTDKAEAQRVFAAASTDDLLARLGSLETPCTDRLLAAETLAARELDAAAKAKLDAWLATETSSAVKAAIERALGR
jgi:arylsulfatase A-like enzyme